LRKRALVALSIFCLIGVGYFFSTKPAPFPTQCPFCDPTILERQTFYEDDLVLALCTHKPIYPGHCLVIPKRHVERFEHLTDEESAQIMRVLKEVDTAVVNIYDTSSYLLLQKNGLEAGQTVPHVHFHYIPRKAGNYSVVGFLFKMFIASVKKPISSEKTEKSVERLKKEFP